MEDDRYQQPLENYNKLNMNDLKALMERYAMLDVNTKSRTSFTMIKFKLSLVFKDCWNYDLVDKKHEFLEMTAAAQKADLEKMWESAKSKFNWDY